MGKWVGRTLVLIGVVWMFTGCSPMDEQNTPPEIRRGQRSSEKDIAVQKKDAIQLVMDATPSQGTNTTVAGWLSEEADRIDGQVLFPRWTALRIAEGRFDVRYTYTVVQSDYLIEKRGYQWNADVLMNMVGPATVLKAEEDQARKRLYHHSSTLEEGRTEVDDPFLDLE
ncbi:MAG: hypothetical protein EOL87_07940 [Spartobacteria bacterium]|nr:hypothetical protein [Spartobacteria bacterium]